MFLEQFHYLTNNLTFYDNVINAITAPRSGFIPVE